MRYFGQKKPICPHCGSNRYIIDVDITITCDIDANGHAIPRKHWYDDRLDELREAVASGSIDDYRMFCEYCGSEFNVEFSDDGRITGFSKRTFQ